ncbi:MAG TPA: SDR family oxidoreductase [Sporichthyaceae bacterium]|nr:SDR family oxidoreductase [Sporichthyaceae bacterium]
MDLGLDGRVYLITGASRGLGLAAATALVGEGARVVLVARQEDTVGAAAAGLGERAIGLAEDLGQPEAAERVVAAAHARFGRLDGALLSVGGPPPGSVLDTTDEQWRAAFDTVFLGALRMTRAVARGLGTGGSIALVLSTSVRQPIANLTLSNGLRPGLAMVAKALADELGSVGVRVNGLLPGRIATDRMVQLDNSTGDAAAALARNCATIPLGRYGEPAEFGRVAAFLLSPAASYLTGIMLPVDGGMLRGL